MEFIKDKEQRNATIKSVVIHLLITLFFIFFGLTYLDPPPEDGIAIAFGYDAEAGGEQVEQPTREQQSTPQPSSSQQVEDITTEYTQDDIDAPAVSKDVKKKEKEKPVDTKIENDKPVDTPTETEKKPVLDDRLRNLTSNPNPTQSGTGSGTSIGDGIEGREDGSGDRGGSQGGGGIGSSGDYRLGNRKALNKVKPVYECQEEGRIVVRIRVNQQGKVMSADSGVNIPNGENSTSTSSCLIGKAYEAAMRTSWQSDSKAPDLQMGYIIYNFRKN